MSLDSDESSGPSPYVILVSQEGHEFVVTRDVVQCSGFIRNILNSPAQWAETASRVPKIELNSISTPILEKVLQYFHYKQRYDTVAKRPKFDIPLEMVTQVLVAANFLDT